MGRAQPFQNATKFQLEFLLYPDEALRGGPVRNLTVTSEKYPAEWNLAACFLKHGDAAEHEDPSLHSGPITLPAGRTYLPRTTHSVILAWRTPWREEPGGLQARGHKALDMTDD